MIRLVRRVEVPVPTLAGWGVVGSAVAVVAITFVATVYPFLAVNQPIGSGSLVVEGWMNRESVLTAIELFESEGYDRIYTTGGPIVSGSYFSLLYPDHETHAEVAAHQFLESGVSADRVVAVPRVFVPSNRTYFSALALRLRLIEDGLTGHSLDILVAATHARRSWLLFEEALAGVGDVGVRALPPRSFDPDRWWTTSVGVRTVVSEVIAYCYAKFLFYPDIDRDVAQLEPILN